MKKIIKFITAICVVCVSVSSYAFKVDTHVWVGQQVINDLEDDGKLTIKLGDKPVDLVIPTDVKDAILNNKSAFLMGNIGPDAVPDVVVGQTVVHPGVENKDFISTGWRTNQWLEYLLSVSKNDPVAKAFTYGYLGHAAADVMAHTYVNQYAGDIFRLTDGETLVEQRHMVLEGYIAKYTPPLTDRFGNSVGGSWQNIISKSAYTDFIRKNLVYENAVITQYKKVPSAAHLVAYAEFRNGIDKLAESEIWHDIDIAVTQIASAYFDVELSSNDANTLVNNMQPVMEVVNGKIPDSIQDSNRQFYTEVARFDKKVFKNLSVASEQMKIAEQNLLSKHQSWRRKLLDVKNLPSCPRTIVAEDCKLTVVGISCDIEWGDEPACSATKKVIEESNRVVLAAASALENEVLALNNNLRFSTITAQNELSKATVSAQKIQESLIDMFQGLGGNVSPIQSELRAWRGNVDTAMTAYVTATSQMMLNTLRPATRIDADGKPEKAIAPLITWFNCYHLNLIGMDDKITCEFKNNVLDLKKSIEKVMLLAEQATSVGSSIGIPGPVELQQLQDVYIQRLIDALQRAITDKIETLLPEDIKQILAILDQNVDDALLNQYFTKVESEKSAKGLVMIPDLADRVKAEMHLTASGKFDPDQYPVAYNAVVLAKLALLDKVNFDQLAQAAGSTDYSNYFSAGDNLVAQAFASIDGNHQWMPVPPPYPNSLNIYLPVDYTYSSSVCKSPSCVAGPGFAPWKGDMRDKLFRKLFKGPLSPGIDAPQVINKQKVIAQDYPYQTCAARGFPDDIYDRVCIAILLIPVFSSLLH